MHKLKYSQYFNTYSKFTFVNDATNTDKHSVCVIVSKKNACPDINTENKSFWISSLPS